MPKTMKAAVVREFCKQLVIKEAAVPDPGLGRRAFGRQAAQPGVVPIAKTHAVRFLDQFDPVEDSSPHIGGPLEE